MYNELRVDLEGFIVHESKQDITRKANRTSQKQEVIKQKQEVIKAVSY